MPTSEISKRIHGCDEANGHDSQGERYRIIQLNNNPDPSKEQADAHSPANTTQDVKKGS